MSNDMKLKELARNNPVLAKILALFGFEQVKRKASELGLSLDNEENISITIEELKKEHARSEAAQDGDETGDGIHVAVGDDDIEMGLGIKR